MKEREEEKKDKKEKSGVAERAKKEGVRTSLRAMIPCMDRWSTQLGCLC